MESLKYVRAQDYVNDSVKEATRIASTITSSYELGEAITGTNIFIGIGLTSRRRVSEGLNPCVIEMTLIARQIQQELNRRGVDSKILAMIADVHAIESAGSDAAKVAEIAASSKIVLERLLKLLGAPFQHVFLASERPVNAKHTVTYEDRQADYVQAASNEWGSGVKVGWMSLRQPLSAGVSGPIMDEKYFDHHGESSAYHLLKGRLAYVYTKEGVSFVAASKDRSQMLSTPPYFSDSNSHALGQIRDISEVLARIERTLGISAKKHAKNRVETMGKVGRKILDITDAQSFEVMRELIRECARE